VWLRALQDDANVAQRENVFLHSSLVHDSSDHIDRTKRVKDAKTEAQKEIEEYRKKKEEEFKKFQSEVRPRDQTGPNTTLTLS